VWLDIAEKSARLGASSPTSAMEALFEGHAAKIDAFVRAMSRPSPLHGTRGTILPIPMPLTLNLQRQLTRFQRMPQVDDVWEGAIVLMPMWIEGKAGADPHRPAGALWVSTARRVINLEMFEGDGDEAAMLSALFEMGTSMKFAGYRPRALRVQDERLAASLEAALDGLDITVEVAPDLPALDEVRAVMAAEVGDDIPSALDAPGVTPERLRAFADAARQFYDAAPWRHLDDGDLIRVEAPRAGKGLTLVVVMGSAGRQFGLAFFSSVDRYRAMMEGRPPGEVFTRGGEWAVYFSPGWETSFGDLDAWSRHGLPLVSDRAYPTAIRLDPRGPRRPDAGRLAYLEGLLRTLAATTEAEMDSGRWSHTVPTADGSVEYTLTLPALIEPDREATAPRVPDRRSMERFVAEVSRTFGDEQFDSIEAFNAALAERFTGTTLDDLPSTAATPLERAQDLVYEAFEAGGRRQLQLIRRALELSPECADAYVLLAERTSSLDEKRSLYEQAVAAGERALGPEAFSDPNRPFWGDVSTRPYMRARQGLAECLQTEGAMDEAAGHYQALLQLNPDDNQGVRYLLLALLLQANRNDEAGALLAAHDEASALWSYASVLLALRAGDRRLARKQLRAAVKANRHVPRYLAGQRELPDILPETYTWGSDDEAVLCASELRGPWTATPDAVAWLRAETRRRR
jgi:tetratricopeptide (TPR) repeat protein